MAKSYEEWLKEIKAQNEAQLKADINKYNTVIDKEVADYKADHIERVDETQKEFEQLYDLNEVQRIINEKKLAERMANIGIDGSGFDRTQNTAVQLSYSNEKGDIKAREQIAINSLKSQLNEFVNESIKKKSDNEISLTRSFEEKAQKQAKELYEAELKAETERIKAQNETSKKSGGSSISASKRSEEIEKLEDGFADLYKNYKGVYNTKNLNTALTKLLEAESKYGLTAFECMVILANARIDYDDYVVWKTTRDEMKIDEIDTSAATKIITSEDNAPRWLRKDYVSNRKKGY